MAIAKVLEKIFHRWAAGLQHSNNIKTDSSYVHKKIIPSTDAH